MAENVAIPFYEPGRSLTGQASAAVTGKRCLAITGDKTADGNITVAHAAAAGRIVGVAEYDAAVGAKVGVLRGAGLVVPIRAATALAAFQEVEVGADGQVIARDAVARPNAIAIGYAITAAAINTDAQINLYG